MKNVKKIDEKDFVFVNRMFTKNEEKDFSDFLKRRKRGTTKRQIAGKIRKELA